jgi:hypothetical protein
MKKFSKVSMVIALAAAFALVLVGPSAALATTTAAVNLRTADSFAILSYAGITDAGDPQTSRILAGDIGTTPAGGSTIELLTSQMTGGGTIYDSDGSYGPGAVVAPGMLTQALIDVGTAYNDASGRTPVTVLAGDDNQLGGKTLPPGVYSFSAASTANLIGTLQLDPAGDPDPNWIFLAESSLVVGAGSEVVLLGNATPCDVFWRVPSAATINAGANFVGNIMAYASIAMKDGATLRGTALARTESVTLIDNDITKTPCPFTAATVPYTGGVATNEISSPWNTAMLAGVFTVSILFAGLILFMVARRKRQTS